ncbi:AraC family transcriptional regulator [Pelagicoccus sp. SDUM812005]|nr:AraC family transcriptional regulator [Pelagicoccus sp. SDUM812005]MDQ8181607.1 AraC family transcriptional regulator [Pelagicoccus sp. SDUM812005]
MQLFRVTQPIRCAPAVYEPSVVAIVSGAKEAVLDGKRHVYGSDQYMCCSLSMPVEAGTPEASPDNPLLGVYIALDSRVMTQLAIELENVAGVARPARAGPLPQGVALAAWDEAFADSLLRLLQICNHPTDTTILGEGRLRELYYAVLKGEAGDSARRAFGVGNEIARAIDYLSSRLEEPVSIEAMVSRLGMSRAVFHRKFKQATTMSPIQFVKSMRLNRAAMKMVAGTSVSEAALSVGYESSSQFSREFKRLYGKSPRQWSQSNR